MAAAPPANDQFIHEQVKARYEFEYQTSSLLDTKASTLVGWAGVIISLILGGGSILFTSSQARITSNELYILVGSLASLIGSLAVSLIAFRLIEYEAVPETIPLIRRYGKAMPQKTLRDITYEMALAAQFNANQNEKKANWVSLAMALFTVGMIAASVFVTMEIAKMVGKS